MTSELEIILNDKLTSVSPHFKMRGYGFAHMKAAQNRYMRFLPYIASAFPETAAKKGVIESPIQKLSDAFFLKDDRQLPIANCLQGRGAIHAVLKEAEIIAQKAGILNVTDNYSKINSENFKKLYHKYSLVLDGNSKFLSSAKKIGSKLGLFIIPEEELSDSELSKTIENRLVASEEDIFFGYSTAAFRLKIQLYKCGFDPYDNHPLFVFIQGDDSLAAYGLIFGLKQLLGDFVHCFIINPSDNDDNFGADIASSLLSGKIITKDLKTDLCLGSFITATNVYKSDELNDYIQKHGLTSHMENSAHVMWIN